VDPTHFFLCRHCGWPAQRHRAHDSHDLGSYGGYGKVSSSRSWILFLSPFDNCLNLCPRPVAANEIAPESQPIGHATQIGPPRRTHLMANLPWLPLAQPRLEFDHRRVTASLHQSFAASDRHESVICYRSLDWGLGCNVRSESNTRIEVRVRAHLHRARGRVASMPYVSRVDPRVQTPMKAERIPPIYKNALRTELNLAQQCSLPDI
jgi:hypothetical protein